jgi:hypothetical protein
MWRKLNRRCRIATNNQIYKLNISLSTEAATAEDYQVKPLFPIDLDIRCLIY